MAIVQISKIQQRSGNLVDLPQLDDAEFGWANDEKRLFIGKTTPNENIEVLTSYSNISFSQIDGASNANLNLSNTANGQILGIEITGSNVFVVNKGGNPASNTSPGGLVNLGDVSNVKLHGGAIGYVLETDGTGNLSWTTKGTIVANIIGLSNATPIVMTVVNTTPYTNQQAITISGVEGNGSENVNSSIFYLELASNYPTTGNVSLYTTPDVGNLAVAAVGAGLEYDNPGNAIAAATVGGGGGIGNIGGSTTSIQYNNSGILAGDSNLVYDFTNRILTLSGNANVANLNAIGSIRSSTVVSNVATGTAPITVTSTTRVANLNVNHANVSDFEAVTTQTTGTFYPVFVNANTTANYALGSNAAFSFNAATGNLISTLLTGTLTTAAQPNITSVGSLTTLTVTGNANVGNLGTAGLIIATGNVTGGNINTGGVLSVTGNANVGNLGTAGLIIATGNVTGGNLLTGGVLTATGNVSGGNINTGGALSVTGNANTGNLGTSTAIITTGNITTINSGLLQNGNSNITITANGNINLSATGTPNEIVITSTGINVAGTLNANGNANVGNLGTAGLIVATGNVTGGNLVTGGAVIATGNVTAGNLYANSGTLGVSTANIVTLNVTGLSNLNAVGNVRIFGGNANQILQTDGAGNLSWTDPNGGYYLHTQVSANTVWTVTHNLNRQYVTVEAIDDNGNSYAGRYDYPTISYVNANALTMTFESAVQGYAAVTGGGININTSNVGNSVPGGVNTQVQFNDAGVLGGSSGLVYNKTIGTLTATLYAGSGANLSNIAGANVTGQVSFAATANAVAGANVSGAVSFATTANAVAGANVSGAVAFATTANAVAGANVSGTVANAINAGSATTAGTVTTAAQPNITSVGTLSSLAVTGNISAGNISASGNISAGNFVGTGVGSPTISSSGTLSISATSGVTLNNVLTLSTGGNTTAGNITGNWTLTSGSRLQSTYADLAEYYEADSNYESGTVLAFSGEKEVTIAEDGTTRVAGVVSTNPAYAMNATCQGIAVAIALQGRVPTKVRGTVRKGDMMVSAGNGYARSLNNPQMGTVIGKALENFDGVEGIIEIAVGRL